MVDSVEKPVSLQVGSCENFARFFFCIVVDIKCEVLHCLQMMVESFVNGNIQKKQLS